MKISHEKNLIFALEDLYRAIDKMFSYFENFRGSLRLRQFIFCDGVKWPIDLCESHFLSFPFLSLVRVGKDLYKLSTETHEIARIIINACGGQPRKILRALRRIQAATSWCLKQANCEEKI